MAEDNLKGKARKLDVDEYVITSDMLVEIVEESIRIFWRFIRADKDCAVASVNGHKKVPEFLDAEDLNLLAEIKKVLLKVSSYQTCSEINDIDRFVT